MNEILMQQMLSGHEGERLDVYRDTRKILTVGKGHRVLDADHLKLGDVISKEESDALFSMDFKNAIAACRRVVPIFDKLPGAVQFVILSMEYNNGEHGLAGFKKCIAAVIKGDWVEAANQIVDSDNYRSKDLHGRYETLQMIVRSVAL